MKLFRLILCVFAVFATACCILWHYYDNVEIDGYHRLSEVYERISFVQSHAGILLDRIEAVLDRQLTHARARSKVEANTAIISPIIPGDGEEIWTVELNAATNKWEWTARGTHTNHRNRRK